jgi:hypothetical protein
VRHSGVRATQLRQARLPLQNASYGDVPNGVVVTGHQSDGTTPAAADNSPRRLECATRHRRHDLLTSLTQRPDRSTRELVQCYIWGPHLSLPRRFFVATNRPTHEPSIIPADSLSPFLRIPVCEPITLCREVVCVSLPMGRHLRLHANHERPLHCGFFRGFWCLGRRRDGKRRTRGGTLWQFGARETESLTGGFREVTAEFEGIAE